MARTQSGQKLAERFSLTYKRKWTGQRDEALAIIETNVRTIFDPSSASLTANLDGDATLPGPLDPAAFRRAPAD